MPVMVIKEGLRVRSALVDEGCCLHHAFELITNGMRARFTISTDAGFTTIAQDERGTFEDVGGLWGEVWLRLDAPHKGLIHYDNSIVLVPFVTDEILAALEVLA